MPGLELPGGMHIAPPDPTAVQIVQALAPMLQAISNQLDLLIRLECGHIDRDELREQLTQAQQRLAAEGQNGHVG